MVKAFTFSFHRKVGLFFAIPYLFMAVCIVYLLVSGNRVPAYFSIYVVMMTIISFFLGHRLFSRLGIDKPFRIKRFSCVSGVLWGSSSVVVLLLIRIIKYLTDWIQVYLNGGGIEYSFMSTVMQIVIGFVVSTIFIFIPISLFIGLRIRNSWSLVQSHMSPKESSTDLPQVD